MQMKSGPSTVGIGRGGSVKPVGSADWQTEALLPKNGGT
jgi:hypothetical protein